MKQLFEQAGLLVILLSVSIGFIAILYLICLGALGGPSYISDEVELLFKMGIDLFVMVVMILYAGSIRMVLPLGHPIRSTLLFGIFAWVSVIIFRFIEVRYTGGSGGWLDADSSLMIMHTWLGIVVYSFLTLFFARLAHQLPRGGMKVAAWVNAFAPLGAWLMLEGLFRIFGIQSNGSVHYELMDMIDDLFTYIVYVWLLLAIAHYGKTSNLATTCKQ